MGVPAGLLLAGHFGWHAPFYVLAGLSMLLGVCVPAVVPKVAAHVVPGLRPGGGWRADFTALLRARGHGRALASVFIFTLSGFMLYPFLSAYQVKNVGIGETELAWVFFCGGLATIVTSRLIGWSADRFGKRRMFLILAWCSIAPILVTTHMPRASVWVLIAATTPFMVLMSGRFIPLMALVSMCVNAPMRGAFMSLSSAAQNLAAGVASMLAGAMIGHGGDGALTGFGHVGVMAAALTVMCVGVAGKLRPAADVGRPRAVAA
jgi:predicted MFS family arabinose efflux permease